MAKKNAPQNESKTGTGEAGNAKPTSAKSVKIAPAKGRPMLHWVGKKPLDSVRTYPAQMVETFHGNGDGYEPNLLFHGDNKEVLTYLLTNGYRGQIDLIYIDPPFDSKADYVRNVQLRGPRDKHKFEGAEQTIAEQLQYADIWANDTYLQFMYERFILLRELLAENGSIFVHCDPNKGHHIRCLLDEVFGDGNFINEVIWSYRRWPSNSRSFQSMHDNIFYYAKNKGSDRIFNKEYEEASDSYMDRFGGKTQILDTETGTRKITSEEETKGMPRRDVWDISIIAGFKSERTGYPTQKPTELLERIIEASSNSNALILDCFIGSGTTAAVAQKLGRRWIACDINKGAIQTTSKLLQTIIRDQVGQSRKGKLAFETTDDNPVKPVFSFAHYRINDYDLQIQHNEALELALQYLNVDRNRTDGFFDGLLGKKLVRVVPLNHPCTLLDLQLVENELKNRPDEGRDIIVVALGKDANVDAFLADYNKRRKVNKIVIIELRSDPKYGGFFEHQPAWVTLDVKAKDGTAKIAITDFCSPTILERLNLDQTVFREKITDFRSMIDVVLVDTNYNGKVFNIAFSDVPEKKTDFVKAKYEIPLPANSKRIAVKVIDMLGEEVLEVRDIK